MKTSITFRHMKATPAIKDFIMERLARLDRVGRGQKEAHVILSVDKAQHEAEVIVTLKGLHAQAKSSTFDMYASIDEAIDKVEQTLRRHKSKKVKERNHSPRSVASL